MGNGASRAVGCFMPSGVAKGGVDLEFLEPLDEGLGHSFCYVRPVIVDSPAITPSNSERYTADLSTLDSTRSATFRQEIADELAGLQRSNTISSETTFRTISGASVSANASTAPTGNPNVLIFGDAQEPAASFESTASFAAVPLKPVPRGSGPLNGFLSGPLERGFASGPLERGAGLLSGPLDKGFFMSGPLDSAETSNLSAPLGHGRGKARFGRLMRSMSRPMRSVLSTSFAGRPNGRGWIQRSLLHPMTNLVWRAKEARHPSDPPVNGLEAGTSEPEYCSSRNLQWAHGKAGEDRVHVVLSEEQGWLFIGIYDGFNGPDAPDFLMSNLYKAIDKELEGLLWDYEEKSGNIAPVADLIENDTSRMSCTIGRKECVTCQLHQDETQNSVSVNLSLVNQTEKGVAIAPSSKDNIKSDSTMFSGLGDELRMVDQPSEKVGTKNICKLPNEIPHHCNANKDDASMDTEGHDAHRRETSSMPTTKLESKYGKDNKLLYELLQLELLEDLNKDSCMSSDNAIGSGMDCWKLHFNANERFCSQEVSSTAQQVSGSTTCKRKSSGVGEESGGLRERDVVVWQNSEESKQKYVVPFSSLGQKQMMRISLLGSRLRKLYRKHKSSHKKLFPWSYYSHGDPSNLDDRIANSSVVIRQCMSGPVDHDGVLNAMTRALIATEEAYVDMVQKASDRNPELALMGSCVLVMLMKDQDVYVMNLGDSRTILAQDRPSDSYSNPILGNEVKHGNRSRDSLARMELDRISEESPMHNSKCQFCDTSKARELSPCSLKMRAVQLSSEHSTSIEEELLRIKAEHADDAQAVLNNRVKGQLKVTRAFGAEFLKKPNFNQALLEMFRVDYIGNSPYISCTPSVLHHHLSSNDRFLVLSSDGLYQYFSNEEVVSHVTWFMENAPEGDPAQYLIAELLIRAAKKNGMDFHELLDIPQGDRRRYHDDVSVMVISLEGRIWRSSG